MDMNAPTEVKHIKLAIAECFFPELKGPAIYRTGRGRGSTARVAIARAFESALRQNKGKRFQSIKATITVTDEANNEVQRITEETNATEA
jgi:hypothetical protein